MSCRQKEVAMRLKVALGCLLGLLLVFSPALAEKADDPPSKDALPCMEEASEGTPACCAMHRHGAKGHGKGHGHGPGAQGDGCCGGCAEKMASDADFQKDHELFFFLLDHRADIQRKVKMLDDGIVTVTESKDPKVAEVIQEHVASVYERVDEGKPIHQRDPLFAELFRHTDKIEMIVETTKKGVRVTETSEDPHVAALIQAHAEVVSLFLKNGHSELHKNHAVPGDPDGEVAEGGCPHRMAEGE
jgi:hypothetical protein